LIRVYLGKVRLVLVRFGEFKVGLVFLGDLDHFVQNNWELGWVRVNRKKCNGVRLG
jgi:hypothetical protein